MRPTEEHLLLDLLGRGICLIPEALPQLACRSKTLQVQLFSEWMPPQTVAIHDGHQLLAALSLFSSCQQVITKLDRKNGGVGVHLWSSVEDVYNQASLGALAYPFVLQPYCKDVTDIRVIIIDDYLEAYERKNPDNFRNNIHCGGVSTACKLTDEQLNICKKVMNRGRFPYAHLDLIVTSQGENYLMEINLRGGIKGAKIASVEYQRRIEEFHQKQLHDVLNS